jgi:hypothetical protein
VRVRQHVGAQFFAPARRQPPASKVTRNPCRGDPQSAHSIGGIGGIGAIRFISLISRIRLIGLIMVIMSRCSCHRFGRLRRAGMAAAHQSIRSESKE